MQNLKEWPPFSFILTSFNLPELSWKHNILQRFDIEAIETEIA